MHQAETAQGIERGNTTVALLSWFVLAPVGFFINTRMPPDVRDYFGKY